MTGNKIPQYLSPIIKTSSTSSDSESETNLSKFVPNKDKISNIEILNTSSDSRSETEIEEPSFAHNKNVLPKITSICILGKNEVKLVKDFQENKNYSI